MDLTEMLAQLMLDLKMTAGTEISVDEATRCIGRAVDDLSRHVPNEKIYEHTWVQAVTDDSFAMPAAGSAANIVATWDISAVVEGAATCIATIITNTGTWRDVPRPVKITLTDANNTITRMTLVVKGTDSNGVYREERFYRHDGKVQTGKVYFSSIYEVKITEIAGQATSDALTVGTDEPNLATGGIWVQLKNPVEPDSESIYSALLKTGTKYVLDTDYEMDYANGRIRMKYGGSMVAGTTYYANYSRHNLSVDVTEILPDLTRIIKVLYPADKVPEQQVAFSIWENMLTIGSQKSGESQKALADKEHVAIYYETKHSPPTYVGSGSYPAFLDQVVLIGSGGYALLVEALQHELQAATDLAEIRTTLGYLGIGTASPTFVHSAVVASCTNLIKYLDNNSSVDAAGILQDITDAVANLRTKIYVAWDAANAFLDEVDTTDLGQATVGGEAYLQAGDDLINTVPVGALAAENYALYARARAEMGQVRTQAALGYLQEAASRLNDIMAYIQQSAGYNEVAKTFAAEGQIRLGELNGFLQESAQYQEVVANDLLLADRFRTEGNNRLAIFFDLLKSRAGYRKRIVDVSVRQPG